MTETIEQARNLVRTAYRLLLDREPESEAVVDAHLSAEGGGTNRAVSVCLSTKRRVPSPILHVVCRDMK